MRLILVVVAWAVLALARAGVPAPDPESDATLIPQLTRVLSTASAGHLFQAAPGESFILPAYDLGMFAWPSLAVVAIKAVAPGYQPDLTLWFDLQFALFALAVLVCALPAVPLRLSAGAIAFLVGHVVFAGHDPLGGLFAPHYYGYWAPPLASVLALVYLLVLARADRPRGLLTLAAGLTVGILGTWRVDAALIPALAAGAFALRLGVTPTGRRTALWCLLFIGLTRVPDLTLRAALTAHQAATGVAHFQDGGVRGHMLWHNLYLSYVSVPLAGPRAEWDDTIGWLHATEYEPRLTTAQSAGRLSADHDRALLGLYAATAWDHPRVWLQALATRLFEIADLCWPSLTLAMAILFLWHVMTEGTFTAGPFRITCAPGPARDPALAWAVLLALCAAALPPLLYSTLPWYARAVQLVARALPWFLLLAGAGAPSHTPPLSASLTRRLARGVALALAVLALAGLAGELRRACYVRSLDALDLARFVQAFGEDPRRLRTHLTQTPPALATALRSRYGAVKGGGTITHRAAPARLVFAARVGLHMVLWLEATAPWPGKGAMRDQGGWLHVDLDDPRPATYRMRIPRFERGDVFPVILPVAPTDETPVTAHISLRAWPITTSAESVATVHKLTRTLAW